MSLEILLQYFCHNSLCLAELLIYISATFSSEPSQIQWQNTCICNISEHIKPLYIHIHITTTTMIYSYKCVNINLPQIRIFHPTLDFREILFPKGSKKKPTLFHQPYWKSLPTFWIAQVEVEASMASSNSANFWRQTPSISWKLLRLWLFIVKKLVISITPCILENDSLYARYIFDISFSSFSNVKKVCSFSQGFG